MFSVVTFIVFIIENPGKMARAEGKESGADRKGKMKKQQRLSTLIWTMKEQQCKLKT